MLYGLILLLEYGIPCKTSNRKLHSFTRYTKGMFAVAHAKDFANMKHW